MKKTINKNIKVIVLVSAVAAILLGGLLLLISGNETSSPGEISAAEITTDIGADNTEPSKTETATAAETTRNSNTSDRAAKLYAARVESISDGAAIAKLAETINLEKEVGRYTMEIQKKEAPKSISIIFDMKVPEKKRIKLDEEIQGYAQIFLALVADAEQIEWEYQVKKKDGKTEEVTVFLKAEEATKMLGSNVKAYGASEEAVDKLLKEI